MVFVRIVVLLFLVAYAFSMGQLKPHELNGFGKLVSFSFFIFAPMLYFLPSYEAARRNHPSLMAIILVNLFLGWTFVGWVAVMAWANSGLVQQVEGVVSVNDGASVAPPLSVVVQESAPTVVEVGDDLKDCPFCAEKIKLAAIKCKHCGSMLAQASGA